MQNSRTSYTSSGSESKLSQTNIDSGQNLYEKGISCATTWQFKEALRYFNQAADLGYPAAYLRLGLLYEYDGAGPVDKEKSQYWYKKSEEEFSWFKQQIEKNHAEAPFNLALCYVKGIGVAQDMKLAVEWYNRAAEQGHCEAFGILGYCYEYGIGVAQDNRLAFHWLQKAAEQEDQEAQNNLAFCYAKGKLDVAQDEKMAFHWWQKAAELGHPDAKFYLAWCYEHGKGIGENEKLAFEWYQKAALQGLCGAQYKLGQCFEHGKGAPKNDDMAFHWYQKAVENENEDAKIALKRLFFSPTYSFSLQRSIGFFLEKSPPRFNQSQILEDDNLNQFYPL